MRVDRGHMQNYKIKNYQAKYGTSFFCGASGRDNMRFIATSSAACGAFGVLYGKSQLRGNTLCGHSQAHSCSQRQYWRVLLWIV